MSGDNEEQRGRGKPKGSPKSGGRKKGTPNKVTGKVREAILQAFEEVGGVEYLTNIAQEDHKTFCMLLAKVLPTQVTGADDKPLIPDGFKIQIVKSDGTSND